MSTDFLADADITLQNGSVQVDVDRSNDRIHLKFMADATVILKCDRSLEHFPYDLEAQYEVMFDPNFEEEEDFETHALRPLALSSNKISIEKEVRDSIMLEIPLKKIHPKFLNEDGSVSAFERVFASNTETEEIDPRWESLKNLKNNA